MAGHRVKVPYPNPLKELRSALGITMDHAARELSVSKQLIARYEAGIYADPGERYVEYLLSRSNLPQALGVTSYAHRSPPTETTIIGDYHLWQLNMRRENYGILHDHLYLPKFPVGAYRDQPVPIHPLIYWRAVSDALPLTTLCKALCIQQANASNFENHPERSRTVPEAIIYALASAGYSPITIACFRDAFKSFQDRELERTMALQPVVPLQPAPLGLEVA